jgi:hypothetical protein
VIASSILLSAATVEASAKTCYQREKKEIKQKLTHE